MKALRRVLVAATVTIAATAGDAASAEVVSSDPVSSPSFNGPVYAVAYAGDTVYVGGNFTVTSVNGRNSPRTRLAAFDARTGDLLDWRPTADANVRGLAVSNGVVYAAGDFDLINGESRDALAGIDGADGRVTPMRHTVAGQPNTITAGHGRIYLGGRITAIDGVPRANLAAFDAATGLLDPTWRPATDDTVNALAVGEDRVYVGGSFHKTNDVRSTLRLTAVHPVTGELDKRFQPRPVSQVLALAADVDGVFAALGGQGGRAVAYNRDGQARWTRVFDGDAQAITVLDGTVYVGGHFDRACTTTNNGIRGLCTDGSVARGKLAAVDRDGNLLGWAPQANGVAGTRQLAASDRLGSVSAVGDFTQVGGLIRKRYVEFHRAAPMLEKAVAGPVAAYNFDSTVNDGTYDDGSGQGHVLHTVARNGATPRMVPHGRGHAVGFPAKCSGGHCPRLVLRAGDTTGLNPGTGPLRYGAGVLLSPTETGRGENILQKGYSTGGGQYKLQVDGRSGHPSCGMSDEAGTVYVVHSATTVADGRWHSLECRRSGADLTILVDGRLESVTTIPATLSVNTEHPITIGGKGVGRNNDQFHGTLDDVWVRIGS
ncbi:MAG TPA: LamG-like jellyroll fold domain-containing protein [Actinoplanes sp.]|nr:LamG-like jellyroll fold domain-containing protein [Actinoplanes sp.]